MIRPVSADGRIETGGVFTPVLRSRLIERITTAASQRVSLIVAPAGYGKSVALRQYLETQKNPLAFYSVRAEHATLLGFLRGLSEALSEVSADLRKTLSGAYEANRASATRTADLAMWVHAHIKSFSGLIAIDDLHVTENDPEIGSFLASLIDRTKGRVRWIIASRSSVGLPVASWLAYGDMDLTVDDQDLRFSLDDARQAAKNARVSVRDDELSEILNMTAGWPTAVSFALRSSTRSVDLKNIAATTREMIYGYLAQQVYQALEPSERDLLLFTSFLDEIDISVLNVAGFSKAKAIMESLRNRVAFIYAERPGLYKCHDLFRDFLRHEIELEGQERGENVQKHVAVALEASGHVAQALSTFAALRSSENVVRLLERHGFALNEQGHADTVLRGLDSLPPDVRATNALVLGLRGIAESNFGRFDRAESLLRRALANATDPELKAHLSIYLALTLANQMRDIVVLLEPLVDQELSKSVSGEIFSLLAVALAYSNREQAKTEIARAESISAEIDDDEARAKILHRVGIASFRLGMPLEYVSRLQNVAASLASEHGMFSLAGRSFAALASIALTYEDDASKEVWYAQQAANAAAKAGDRLNLQTALLQLLNVEGRRGNLDRIKALEQQLAPLATSDSDRIYYMIPVRAFVAAWEGRFAEAHRLMATVAGSERFLDFDRALNGACDSIFLIADAQRDKALARVSQTLSALEEINPSLLQPRRQVEISRMLCAATEALAGRDSHARKILQKKRMGSDPVVGAVRVAVGTIVQAARVPGLQDDVMQHLDCLQSMGYGGISRILRLAFEQCVLNSVQATEWGLTRSERQILESLGDGQSPKEIALDSGRSIYTVQAHIQNIIRKLGCRGRSEALIVARNRGLIA